MTITVGIAIGAVVQSCSIIMKYLNIMPNYGIKMKSVLYLTGLVAVSLAASIALAPALATVLADYLQLESTEVQMA